MTFRNSLNLVLALAVFAGCFVFTSAAWAIAPVITGQAPDPLLMDEDTLLTIVPGDLLIDDIDSSHFQLAVQTGANYSIAGISTIEPDPDYSGSIQVPVQIADSVSPYTHGSVSSSARPNYHAVLGDVDLDGDLDAVVAIYGGQDWLYYNQGDGTFSLPVSLGSMSLYSKGIAIGDLNGDGYPDVVAGTYGNGGYNMVYLNEGAANPGSFPASHQAQMSAGPRFSTESVALGDIDNDGDLDAVMGNYGQPATAYLNNGDGTFSYFGYIYGLGYSTNVVKLADFDNDGDLDVIEGNQGYIKFYQNTLTPSGTLGFNAPVSVANESFITYALDVGDVDGNGTLDVIAGNHNQSKRLYLTDGTGALVSAVTIGSAKATWDVRFADFDSDGDLDIIEGLTAGRNMIYRNDGQGSFSSGEYLTLDAGEWLTTYDLAVGDLDGDGDLDVLGANYNQSLSVYLNTPTYSSNTYTVNVTVAPVPDPPVISGQTPAPMVVAEDTPLALSLADLMVTDPDPGDVVTLLGLQDGANYSLAAPFTIVPDQDYNGPLTVPVQVANGTPVLTQEAISAGNYTANAVAAGDIDGDGDQDFVIATDSNEWIQVNDGQGQFTTLASPLPNSSWTTTAIVMGDLNSDGFPDVVSGGPGSSPVRVHINDGAGNYPDELSYSTTGHSNFSVASIALGDVDNDGDLDIVLGNSNSYDQLLLNDGVGTLDYYGTVGTNRSTTGVELADMDGDGDLDLIETNAGTFSPQYVEYSYWFRSNLVETGDLTFNTSNLSANRYRTTGLATGDINNDGDLDLVTVEYSGYYAGYVRIYHNLDGTFTSISAVPLTYVTSSYFNDVKLSDLDGDGDLDIVAGRSSGYHVIYLNNGNGTFAAPLTPGGSTYQTRAIGLVDIDGDGDADVVPANYNGLITVDLNDPVLDSNTWLLDVQVDPVNDPPQIISQDPIAVPMNVGRVVHFSELQIVDPDNSVDDFSLVISDGVDYSHWGDVVYPNIGFSGDLTVPVQVSDGADTGDVFNLTIAVSADTDGDGILDIHDNCAGIANPGQEDSDLDGSGDACDGCSDDDADGVCNVSDNCVDVANPSQADGDGDGVGDACDNCPSYGLSPLQPDNDGDGVGNFCDNCPNSVNVDQVDSDNDGWGDACDSCAGIENYGINADGDNYDDACDPCPNDPINDPDGDGYCAQNDPTFNDSCPYDYDPSMANADGDGFGDVCDNCPGVPSFDQNDTDGDGIGDACESDDDNDGIEDVIDSCPGDQDNDADGDGICAGNGFQSPKYADQDPCPNDPDDDADGDGFCADVDNCPNNTNDQSDMDGDGIGDVCDSDIDGDGVPFQEEICFGHDDNLDADSDGTPDGCDNCPNDPADDVDSDGVCGDLDNCPVASNSDQADLDGDGLGDACDTCPADPADDADADGVCDDIDNCLGLTDADQTDTDGDGIGNLCDDDDDGDGVVDGQDAFPLDPAETVDTDADDVGDNGDNCPATSNPLQEDADADGFGDACDQDRVCFNPLLGTGAYHSLGVQADGAALAVGSNSNSQLNVAGWPQDLVAVTGGNAFSLGLRSDGTLVGAGAIGFGGVTVDTWTEVAAIAASNNHALGLRRDGTVLASGINTYYQLNVGGWSNVVAIATAETHSLGLTADGRVLAAGSDMGHEKMGVGFAVDAVDIAAGATFSAILRENGSIVVLAGGANQAQAATSWQGVIDITAGDYEVVGLKADGSVLSTRRDLSSWANVVAVASGRDYVVGLQADGTVLAAGDKTYGQLAASTWSLGDSWPDPDGDGRSGDCAANPDPWPNDPFNDADADGVSGDVDNCLWVANTDQLDDDLDGVGNLCDNCVAVSNPSQSDSLDGDGIGDQCDNCPYQANVDQSDVDGDLVGDVCDLCADDPANDADDDGYCDGAEYNAGFKTGANDNCPIIANASQTDADQDGLGDACDPDDDNDGVADGSDIDPFDHYICADVDNDSCEDCITGLFNPASDGPDFDSDGLCDDGDTDDDNDGMSDAWETRYSAALLSPFDPSDAGEDYDGDTDVNLTEFQNGTDPTRAGALPPGYFVPMQSSPLMVAPVDGPLDGQRAIPHPGGSYPPPGGGEDPNGPGSPDI